MDYVRFHLKADTLEIMSLRLLQEHRNPEYVLCDRHVLNLKGTFITKRKEGKQPRSPVTALCALTLYSLLFSP